MFWKIGIYFCAIFSVVYGNVIAASNKIVEKNACSFKYKNDIQNKPDIFVTTNGTSGICRVQENQAISITHFEMLKIKYYAVNDSNVSGDGDLVRRGHNVYQTTEFKNFRGLNYDDRTKTLLYFANDYQYRRRETLIRKPFDNSKVLDEISLQDVHQRYSDDEKIVDIAYDWLTNYTYVSTRRSISVIKIGESWKPADIISGSSDILGFAIHPNAGYLFYVEGKQSPNGVNSEFTSSIYRTHLDGIYQLKIEPAVTRSQTFIANLAIDYHLDRVFWSLPGNKLIQSMNLDGADLKTIGGREIYAGRFGEPTKLISFDQQYVYYLTESRKSIRRFNKEDMREDEQFEIVNQSNSKILELVVHGPEAHKTMDDHPCQPNNGECDKYCFVWPEYPERGRMRSCLCSREEKQDGLHCLKK